MSALKIKSWLSQFKQYFFTYSKGFYHLPYNGKSPQSLVDSFDRLPFVKHRRERQQVYANIPFCEGGFHYHKLEEGCWVVYSKMRYKANVAYDLVYDEPNTDPLTDDDYYMLSLNCINNQVNVDKSVCEKHICFPNYCWTFFKPRVRNCDLNFKGADNKYITLYFNPHWLQQNLAQNSLFVEGGLKAFVDSDQEFIIWRVTGDNEVLANFERFDETMNVNGNRLQMDFLGLKHHTLNLIFDFFNLCKEQQVVANHAPIDYQDNFNIRRVEHHLNQHLLGKFPGIEFLASRFRISESKLKNEFKQLFGKPVYQYFQEQQMLLAKELLIENHLLIKEVSYRLGYENTSKFSAAFKKYHNMLPSDLPR